jgi:hypothetical protein
MIRLVRRREAWRLTWQGWLALAVLVIAAALLGAARVVAFLATDDPAPGARILVVEGWLEQADLRHAVAAIRTGRYERVLTTGGPVETWDDPPGRVSSAERAAAFLRAQVPAGIAVTAVPAPEAMQDRTFLSAVMLRDWAARSGVQLVAIDLFSAGVHARRSRMMFRAALGPAVAVGVLSAPPRYYDAGRWWASSSGVKTVLAETLALAWTACCFRAPQAASVGP